MGKIIDLLHDFQDFLTNFSEMMGIVGDMGEMNIPIQPNVRPVKQRPYILNPRYKNKLKVDLDWMLDTGIIENVKE